MDGLAAQPADQDTGNQGTALGAFFFFEAGTAQDQRPDGHLGRSPTLISWLARPLFRWEKKGLRRHMNPIARSFCAGMRTPGGQKNPPLLESNYKQTIFVCGPLCAGGRQAATGATKKRRCYEPADFPGRAQTDGGGLQLDKKPVFSRASVLMTSKETAISGTSPRTRKSKGGPLQLRDAPPYFYWGAGNLAIHLIRIPYHICELGRRRSDLGRGRFLFGGAGAFEAAISCPAVSWSDFMCYCESVWTFSMQLSGLLGKQSI